MNNFFRMTLAQKNTNKSKTSKSTTQVAAKKKEKNITMRKRSEMKTDVATETKHFVTDICGNLHIRNMTFIYNDTHLWRHDPHLSGMTITYPA